MFIKGCVVAPNSSYVSAGPLMGDLQMTLELKTYAHHELNRDVTASGGHYRFTDEVRLPFEGREVLYLKGYAVFDTTCCGTGGCGCVQVQGFAEQWKAQKNAEGELVTLVGPIRDSALQKRIRNLIEKKKLFNKSSLRKEKARNVKSEMPVFNQHH
jgi:hypothetical protein